MNRGPVSRVVHIMQQLDTGGMEKLLVEFARHVDRGRFELRFVCLSARGAIADEIEATGWPVLALGEGPGVRLGLVYRLSRLFRAWGTDVVHAHSTKPLLYGAPAARIAGVPMVVYTRHGQRHQTTRRQTALFRWATKLVDRVVCVSEASRARSIKEGVDHARLCTVWNGVDTARFSYLGPTDRGPAVMIGRLSPEKDVETLLRAVKLIAQQEPLFRLELAGDGPCLEALRQSCADLGIDQQVRFLGNVKDVAGLLTRASMCVLSSITEGISLTVLESMARGLPVVATSVGGNPEVVVDGQTGLLVPPRQPALLAEALLRVWRDPVQGRELGRAARQRVEQHFDIRRMVRRYEMLYDARGAN